MSLGYPIQEPLVLCACSNALSAGHALLKASCSLRARLLLPTRILGMLFSCPRTAEPLGSTTLPLFAWGVRRRELSTQRWCYSISTAFPLYVKLFLHASCSLRAYLSSWYSSMVYIYTRSCSSALYEGHAFLVSSYG